MTRSVTALPIKSDSPPWCSTDLDFQVFPSPEADERLARQVARATAMFEHGLLGRAPTSVTVVRAGPWMVVQVHESFSEVERQLAHDDDGVRRVGEFHRQIFEHSIDALLEHVRRRTGVALRGALAHVDPATRSVFKTLATSPEVDLFLLGQGLPALGVPVNTHLQTNGTLGMQAAGNGADRR